MKTPWWFLYKTPLAILLLPVSWVYFLLSKFVYICRKFHVLKPKRRVICVGNILAGGVGKTPIVRQIATKLNAPVVMRGYKKTDKTQGAGDEALMLARDGIQVHTGNRKSNIILLDRQKDSGTPIIMDDGFQNSAIKKDISILVFDAAIGFGNGFVLPAGPLREYKSAIARADAVIIMRGKKIKSGFKINQNIPVFYADNKTISPYSDADKLVAFAGIGFPAKFFGALENVVAKKSFPDHYQYTDNDIRALIKLAKQKKAKLITTEKDWVRLSKSAQKQIQFAKLETVIQDDFWKWLMEKM